MPAPASWLEEPLARVRGIVEATYTTGGVYLSTKVFQSARLHGDLDDPEFPTAHFHRGYDLLVDESSWMDPETAQSHCGPVRRVARWQLRIGYLWGRDHPLAHSAGVTSSSVARELGHGDHERLEGVLSSPRNWGGTTPAIAAILRDPGPVVTVQLDAGKLIVQAPYKVLVSYAAGTWR